MPTAMKETAITVAEMPEAAPRLPVADPIASASVPKNTAITNMCRVRAATSIPSVETPSITGTARPPASRRAAPAAVSATIEAAFSRTTRVRLTGLPSSRPRVPERSSPAIDPAPTDSAREARVRAP